MSEVRKLNVENEDFEKDLDQLSKDGWKVKCYYTKCTRFNDKETFEADWIILQKDL